MTYNSFVMKSIFLIILVLFLSATIFAQESNNIRVNKLFNFDWKFQTGDMPDAIKPDFNDAAWRTLDIPHDFQFEQPWDKTASRNRGFKAMGIGWYRKTFKADPNWNEKQILLDFEGIMLSGMDLQYIKVYAVDSEGRIVLTFKGEATFDVSGEAKLIAVDNGDHSSDELFSGNKRTMYKGFAMAIVRSTQTAGNVTIKASANG